MPTIVGETTEHPLGTVNVPAGTSTQITVVLTGPEAGTVWDSVVNCPAAP